MTPRQRQIIEGLLSGLHRKEIAQQLGISLKTVECHMGVLFRKYHAKHVAHLIGTIYGLNQSKEVR